MLFYKNQFELNDELLQAINYIIRQHEKGLSFEKLDITIPEQTLRGTTQECSYDWSYAGVCRPQIRNVDIIKRFPEKKYQFLVVIKKKNSFVIPLIHFESHEGIKKNLKNLTELYVEYEDDMFNCEIFYDKFPYLKTFFDYLNNYRSNNYRAKNYNVTISKKVLRQAIEVTLQSTVQSDLTLN